MRSRSAKTILLSAGQAVASLANLGIAMMLSRLLTVSDYATYRLTLLLYLTVAPILSMGLHQAGFYFLPLEKKRTRGILMDNLTLLGIAGGVMSAFLLLGGNRLVATWYGNSDLEITLLLLAPFALAMTISNTVPAFLVAGERVATASWYSILARGSAFLGVVLATWWVASPQVAVGANSVMSLLAAALGIYLLWQTCHVGSWVPTWSGMRAQLGYAIPLGLSSMVAMLTMNLDKIVVSAMLPEDAFAVYVNGAVQLPLVAVITGAMTSVLIVDYRKMIAEQRFDEVLSLVHRAMIKSGTVLLPAMFYLLCVAPELMRFGYGRPEYEASAPIFRLYLLLLPVRTTVFGAVAMAAGYSRQIAIIALIVLTTNLPLTWLGVWLIGPMGAALSTLIVTYLINAVGRAWIATRILKCRMRDFTPYRDMVRLVLCSCVACPIVLLVRWWMASSADFPCLVVTFLVYVLLTAGALYYAGYADFAAVAARIRQTLGKA